MSNNNVYFVYIMCVNTKTTPYTYKLGYTDDMDKLHNDCKCGVGCKYNNIVRYIEVDDKLIAQITEKLFNSHCQDDSGIFKASATVLRHYNDILDTCANLAKKFVAEFREQI